MRPSRDGPTLEEIRAQERKNEADPPARMSTVNLAEVFDVTVPVMRLASAEVSGGVGELARLDRLQIVPGDETPLANVPSSGSPSRSL